MLKIVKSDIIAVAVRPQQYPPDDMAEVAFAGRSNVGKSSLLNFLTGRKKLAKVSSSPGKTRTINFYLINDSFRIVDLPGYGYAKVAKSVSRSWGQMMNRFFESREGLRKVILLVDSRHKPTKQDVQMYDFMKYYGLDGPVVATKSDKVKKNELNRNLQVIRKTLDMSDEAEIIPVSVLKKSGKDKLLSAIEQIVAAE
jgi:GTP-binding protein